MWIALFFSYTVINIVKNAVWCRGTPDRKEVPYYKILIKTFIIA